MKLFGLLIVSLFLLTGCGSGGDFACESLQAELDRTYTLLGDVPSAFEDKTNDEWIRWQRYSKQRDSIQEQMDSLENCYPN